jgi:hypothetical protein
MHNPARKLSTKERKETMDLVVILLSESPKKLAPRRIETSARSMGVPIQHTIQELL